MRKTYFVIIDINVPALQRHVNKFLECGHELIGGPFSFAGMVCQAMMLNVEEETEHEDENIPS